MLAKPRPKAPRRASHVRQATALLDDIAKARDPSPPFEASAPSGLGFRV